MPQDNHNMPNEEQRHEAHTLQDRVCNALAVAGLLAIVLVGGSSIVSNLRPTDSSAQPTATEDVTPLPEEDPLLSTFDEMLTEPAAPAPETVVAADTMEVELPDTTLVATPELPTDTATHSPATPHHEAVHEAPTDSL